MEETHAPLVDARAGRDEMVLSVDLLSARYRGSVFRAWKRLMTFAMGPECRLCGRGGFGRSMAEASRPRDRSYSRSLKSVGYHH